ncbi:MAG: oligopeptide/dipeptide ABC transporter ATP-binding protein [Gemmatimonadota bacterium]
MRLLPRGALEMKDPPILSVRGLRKSFPIGRGWAGQAGALEALAGVDLDLHSGEVLGVVGESGSGKTTLGRCVLRLIQPSGGDVTLDGSDFLALRGRRLRRRRRRLGVVFQDPYTSLNPRMQIGQIVAEPLRASGRLPASAASEKVVELLERVGMEPRFMTRYPHEMSGGQRQRVAIARALATDPDILVADEPVSALDVSVQAQVLNLLLDLKREGGLAMLFISHDLAVVERIADRIAVMYAGRIVESAPTDRLISHPLHPYTQALLSAVPSVDPALRRERVRLRADLGPPGHGVDGCPLAGRCPVVQDVCRSEVPPLEEVRSVHRVACHLAKDQAD